MQFFKCEILKSYNPVIKLLYDNFGKCVEINERNREATVKSRISLRLSFSANEYKIYFDTYITPPKIDRYEVSKENYSFRLFSLPEITQYLNMKMEEDHFILKNEG